LTHVVIDTVFNNMFECLKEHTTVYDIVYVIPFRQVAFHTREGTLTNKDSQTYKGNCLF